MRGHKHISKNPGKTLVKSSIKTALDQKRNKQKNNTNGIQEMATIIASVTQKGATTLTVTSAHLETVQKLR